MKSVPATHAAMRLRYGWTTGHPAKDAGLSAAAFQAFGRDEKSVGGCGYGGCLWGVGVVYPVAGAGFYVEVGVVFEFEGDGVEAGVGVQGVEAEDIAVGDVVGDGEEIAVEGFDVLELEAFAAGEPGYGF